MGCCGPKSPTDEKKPQEAAKSDHAVCDTHHHREHHEHAGAESETMPAPGSSERAGAK